MRITKYNVLSNLFWRYAERVGAQLVSFVVSIILARILGPEAYGTVALLTIFINIIEVLVDSGLGNALIQKKNADDTDFSTVFFTNLTFCLILYIGLYCAAPVIAIYYEDITLVSYIRVLGLVIIVSGLKNVQQAYVSRNMLFKKFFYSTLGGTVAAAVVGVALALSGYGVWALVAQYLVNAIVDTLILWITVKWRPHKVFSFSRLKALFSYGWKLLLSGLLDRVYSNIRQLIIGKLYTPSDLAFYNKGQQFPNFIVSNINSSVDSVLFPVMSNEQESKENLKYMMSKSIKISTYIMAPVMIGLFVISPNLISLVLTDKWLPCVPFLRIFCIIYMFYSIHTTNLNAIKALGRSDLFLSLEVCKKFIGVVALLLTMWHGVMAMAYSMLATSLINQIINSWPNRKLFEYSYLEQIRDILPNIVLAVAMGVIISFVELFGCSYILIMIIQIILGTAVYILGSIVMRNDSFIYIWDIVKEIMSSKVMVKK